MRTYIVYACVACRGPWDGRPYYHPCPHCKGQMGTIDLSSRALNVVGHGIEVMASKITREIESLVWQNRINVAITARVLMCGGNRELARILTPSSGVDWPPWIRSPYRLTR